MSYLEAFIEPFGTLWFIYLLPIFFVVIKLTRRIPWPAIWLIGAAIEMAHINTGWTAIDEFAHRFIYIYTGYLFATQIFALTAHAQGRPAVALIASRYGPASTARSSPRASPICRSSRSCSVSPAPARSSRSRR